MESREQGWEKLRVDPSYAKKEKSLTEQSSGWRRKIFYHPNLFLSLTLRSKAGVTYFPTSGPCGLLPGPEIHL